MKIASHVIAKIATRGYHDAAKSAQVAQRQRLAPVVTDALKQLRNWVSKEEACSLDGRLSCQGREAVERLFQCAQSQQESAFNRHWAFQLGRTLLGLDRLSNGYDLTKAVTDPNLTLKCIMKPERVAQLRSVLNENCRDGERLESLGGLPKILASASPTTWRELLDQDTIRQLKLDTAERKLPSLGAGLNADEILALSDFVHPDNGTFEALTQAGRLKLLGHPELYNALCPIVCAIEGAVDRLSADSHFAFRGGSGPCYKGISLSTPGAEEVEMATFGRSHDFGTPYRLGSPFSTTSEIAEAYTSRDGCNHLLKFEGVSRAAQVRDFHPSNTRDQNEVVVLPSAFLVTKIEDSTCPAPENPGGEKPITVITLKGY